VSRNRLVAGRLGSCAALTPAMCLPGELVCSAVPAATDCCQQGCFTLLLSMSSGGGVCSLQGVLSAWPGVSSAAVASCSPPHQQR
jgi:hypothetical protein